MPDTSMSGYFDLLGDHSRENVLASGSTAAVLNPLGSIGPINQGTNTKLRCPRLQALFLSDVAYDTFETCRDSRVEPAFGRKAEVRFSSLPRAAFGAERPVVEGMRRGNAIYNTRVRH